MELVKLEFILDSILEANMTACLSGAQRAKIHNWRHSSAGKCSATGDPEGGGRGRYGSAVDEVEVVGVVVVV